MILHIVPSGPLATNALLLGCSSSRRGVIIDPAADSKEVLLQLAAKEGLAIEKIILTHSHWDHFVDAEGLKKELAVPLLVHRLDAPNVEHPGTDGLPLFMPLKGVKPDRLMEEGEVFAVGHLSFTVLHTPGHSPGCVCFYCEKEALLISGDTLFCGAIGSLALPTANRGDMARSLERLSLLPDVTRVIPGHGGETTIGRERRTLRSLRDLSFI